ncbi:MAG: hypothetical protein AAF989_10425 [Planctomycetota bacterium]
MPNTSLGNIRLLSSHFATALVALGIAANVSLGDVESQNRKHLITLPDILPEATSDCADEAGAYATAYATLQAAQQAADVAYDDWYECEMNNQQKTQPINVAELRKKTVSVLDRR